MRPKWLQPALAISVAVLVAASLVLIVVVSTQPPTPSPNVLPGPGLNSLQAFDQANRTTMGLTGRPWALLGMQGVVTSLPGLPMGAGQGPCQDLPGVTLWNLSQSGNLNTTLWGGRAVFWQVTFINSSGWLLFDSVLPNLTYSNGPFSPANACVSEFEDGMLSVFPLSYWAPGGTNAMQSVLALRELNSTAWAPTAATYLGDEFSGNNDDAIVYYTLSYSTLNNVDWSTGTWFVQYTTCGLTGRSGYQDWTETAWGIGSSPSEFNGKISGEISCPARLDATYNVTLVNVTATPSLGGWQSAGALLIGLGVNDQGWIYNSTANFLSSWMVLLDLMDSAGHALPLAPSNCTSNDSRLTGCRAPESGWYAVLLSQSGWILDTYSLESSSARWATPNVSVVNNDTLAILSQADLTDTEDVLSFGASSSLPLIEGTYLFES